MPDSIGSLARRAAVAACLVLVGAIAAFAQQPLNIAPAPENGEFLSRFDFNVSAAKLKLAHSDPRFSWDTHWAGNFDLVDYVHGRMTFLADYQALLGREFRQFDPYQSSYLLEAMGSARAGNTEFLGVLNHISRHFGDRFNNKAVAENSLGIRVMHPFTLKNNTKIELRGDARRVIARAYVDYTSMNSIDVTVDHTLSTHTGVYGRGYGQLITVDPKLAGRDNQKGGRVELGLRINGTGAVMHLYVAGEQVIDADQLQRDTERWAMVGFRVLSK